MQAFRQNLRFAFRQLRKAPGFTLTVILTLALGIGATTAIFSLVEGILLRPLPFADANRLVMLGDHLGDQQGIAVTAREISTYKQSASAFSSVGGYLTASYDLSGNTSAGGAPEQVHAARLNASVFHTLGVRPMLGRVFTTQEEDARQPVAVIGYSLWVNRYQRDPNILGKPMVLDRRPYTIAAVMPRSFAFPVDAGRLDQAQVWVPLSLTDEELAEGNTGFWGYHLVARLRNGVTTTQAAQDANRVAQQVMRDFPPGMSALHIRGDVTSLQETAVSEVRPLLRTLFLAVAVVLLLACANVAGLLLVRAIRRRRETAVRLALGARTAAILRESVCEALLLSVAGGLLAIALAATMLRVALHLLPESMPRIDAVSMDWTVVCFALLLALVTGALCSLAPAFAALRTNLLANLKDGNQSGTGAASHSWLRSSLVIAEIAVALVLLTVAGAFLRSLQKMREVDPGFRADHVLVGDFQLPLNQYATGLAVEAFHHAVIERLSHDPGILADATSTFLPATDFNGESAFTLEGVPVASWKLQFAAFNTIGGEYFRALSIPLLAGRNFGPDDRADTPPVVIVNQTMARHAWPGQSALGKRLHMGNPRKNYPWATVTGVVADTKIGAPDDPTLDQWYFPMEQPTTLSGPKAESNLSAPAIGYIVLRSTLPPEQMIQTLRANVAAVDPLLALDKVQPMDDVLSNIEAPRRFNTSLISVFALGALLLAMTGVYAVMAFSVSQRTQEIAIRMALGAPRIGVARLVLLSGAKLALLGSAVGLLGSYAASQLVSGFLFEVSATDPLVYTAAALTMMLLAVLASAIPAMRAAAADPVQALRAN